MIYLNILSFTFEVGYLRRRTSKSTIAIKISVHAKDQRKNHGEK